FQKKESRMPRAHEGVMTSYEKRSTDRSGRVKQASGPRARMDMCLLCVFMCSSVFTRGTHECRYSAVATHRTVLRLSSCYTDQPDTLAAGVNRQSRERMNVDTQDRQLGQAEVPEADGHVGVDTHWRLAALRSPVCRRWPARRRHMVRLIPNWRS